MKKKNIVFCICAVALIALLVVLSAARLDFDVTETLWALFPPVLAIALALISSIRDIPVPPEVIAVGEIGLAGEIRSVQMAPLRAAEAVRLGFTKIAMPDYCAKKLKLSDAQVIPMKSIFDTVRILKDAGKE